MTSDHAFGSYDLTPELLRAATFDEQDGRIDADEVRRFLERVASSVEVFMSQDAPTALRAEFARNVEIAQQLLDAGQNGAEQLRRQAAEEAKRILDEARDATLGLRETVEAEIEQAREQVEAMRGTFIQDLRDLYDRIGASLYRFERAAEESATAPIQEPTRAPGTEFGNERAERVVPSAAPAQGIEASTPDPEPQEQSPEPAEPELPEGAKPPAWRQLPPEAWASSATTAEEPTTEAPEAAEAAPEPEAEVTPPVPEPELPPVAAQAQPQAEPAPAPPPPVAAAEPVSPTEPVASPDAFAVVEDEPLAPGEPLVDLRELAATPPDAEVLAAENPAAPVPPADAGGSWLDAAATPAEVAAPPASTDDGLGGSWLDSPAAAPEQPDVARDDALAEALIAGTAADPALAAAPGAPAVPPPADAPAASPDATAVRTLILDLYGSGQSRENIATYLSQQLGLLNPGAIIDAALGQQQP